MEQTAHKEPESEVSVSIAAGDANQRRARYEAGLGLVGGGTMGLLMTIGFEILPTSILTEKMLIIMASFALGLASWMGFGAWHDIRRFAVVATAAAVAVVCMSALSIVADNSGSSRSQASAVTASPVASGSAPSPTISGTSPAHAAITLYLAGQTGKTPYQDAEPVSGTWIVTGKTYAHSIGYPGLCTQGNVTFALNRPYNYLIATIAVGDSADSADTSDRSKTVTFEVVDRSGNRLGSKAVKYGQHQVIEVPLQAITSITLKTNIDTGGCFSSTSSVAVWGSVHAVRS